MGRGMLFLMTGFIVIFGIVQLSVQNHQHALAKRTPDYYYAEQSKNIAFSAMELAVARLNDHIYFPQEAKKDEFPILKGTGKIAFYKASENFNSTVYLKITGTAADKKTVTTIYAKANRPGFSIYGYFTDKEPNGYYFVTGDTLNGPAHTNGRFHFAGKPVFNGKVTSPHEPRSYFYNKPEYKKGKDFHSERIELPKNKDLRKISERAAEGGLSFNNKKVKIKFKSDGTADIARQTGTKLKCVKNCDTNHPKLKKVPVFETDNYNLAAPDFNGIISSSGEVDVEGTLKGSITVHSKKNIYITGDVTYKDYDPEKPARELSSNNLLGLASKHDVIVSKDAYKHGRKTDRNVNINASILTPNGTFRVQDYNKIGPRGKLRVLGGLIQRRSGLTGLGVPILRSGYHQSVSYDKRFRTNATPSFPKVKRFAIDSWRESTKVK